MPRETRSRTTMDTASLARLLWQSLTRRSRRRSLSNTRKRLSRKTCRSSRRPRFPKSLKTSSTSMCHRMLSQPMLSPSTFGQPLSSRLLLSMTSRTRTRTTTFRATAFKPETLAACASPLAATCWTPLLRRQSVCMACTTADIDFMEILRPAFVSTASQLADTASIPVVQSNADLHNVAVVLGSSDKTLVPLEYCRSDGYCDSNEYEDRKSIYDNGDKDERGERGDLYNNDESDESFDNENTASTANSKDVYESYGIYGIYDSYCSFSRENNNDDDARLCDTPTKPPRGTFAAMQPADALMATDTG
ncbi:hypothetical protein BC831DRAFT_478939 [Entophlyctis helioformis]|nr:hypothetical protein BC831DRAFT_478939 [Entophlyctis helioformis]